MARDEVRVIVLFEDAAQRSFLIQLTERLGLRPVRFRLCVDCTGVLREFEAELATTRQRMRFQPNCALLVCIDADKYGVAGRTQQLEERVFSAGGPRAEHERIAYLIPMLEIENWYIHLCIPAARPIDEARDYKPTPEWRALERDLGRASRDAVRAWPVEPRRQDPMSIEVARKELRRLQ